MRAWPALLAIAVTIASGVARADDDPSEAQRLFDDGRALLEAGHVDAACAKFEQSIAKDPRAVGTLLNLGLCNERRGKPATALALFREAYDRAREANLPSHRDAAQQHLALLQPQIPVLALHVAAAIADERVFVDDKRVTLGPDGGAELQLDPGPHQVVASAPGRLPYTTDVTLAVGKRASIAIPALEVPRARASSRRLLGKLGASAGGVLVLGGGALLGYARHSYHREFTDGDCAVIDGARLCNAHGHDVTQRARSIATAGGVVGALGLVAGGVGLALWLTAPADDRAPHVVPALDATSAGLAIVGRF